jgi:hypothetical protein
MRMNGVSATDADLNPAPEESVYRVSSVWYRQMSYIKRLGPEVDELAL